MLDDAIEGKSRMADHIVGNGEHENLAQKQNILRHILQGMDTDNIPCRNL